MRTRLGSSLLALVAAFCVGGVLIAVTGGNPLTAYLALLEGAFGSGDSLSEVAVKACPLILAGLAVTVAFRTGVWNIGAEGQLVSGALAAAWVGPHLDGWPRPVALLLVVLAAATFGAVWGGIAALLKVRRDVSEIISTIMLNFVALQVVSFLVQGPLMEATGRYPQTDAIASAAMMPRLLPPHRLHAGLLIALALAAVVHLVLFRARAGFELRASGFNADAARLAGIRVDARILFAMLLSGALAGLAGGVEVSAITRRLYERFSPGWGFTSIAVALLGGLTPGGVVVSAFFFGALDAGSNAMQRVAGISSVLVTVLQATVILFIGVMEARRASRA